ncbi:hypothetical protein BU16DRAFT_337747 [Lophium mytilinum]|uniref:Uncharacterized protein n=1 Tax=Lophium mytilinum TaxID=390894 RepID=A0A6A6QXW4_9PEZI|nr:hypothetical protein BU16DRAFT_337747 [Lophium mytilinum]
MAPPKSQKASKDKDGPITDPRFTNFQTDPRYRLPSRRHTHTKLDKRFAHMLKDDDFSQKASVDRYGRKVASDSGRKGLEKFYQLENSENEDEEEDEDEDEEEDDEDQAVQKELERVGAKYDPAREGGFSSSSEDDSESEAEVDDEDVEEAELAQSVEIPMGEVSSRLAVVNLDWDNIRAVDLLAVSSSFVPAEGRILDVTVYPSEFGRERLERERVEGPPKEIFAAAKRAELDSDESPDASDVDSDAEDEKIKKGLLEEDQGDEFNSSALRAYQLDRLRYYYAVITCSSTNVAKSLYDNMDGREYLSSANFFDLRFVPDDVTFDDKPRDECTSLPDSYRPNEFVTDALTHSKVKLTWDADDNTRKEVQKRAFSRKEIDENDLMAYIGSDSSGAEEEDPAAGNQSKGSKAAALRAKLGLGDGSLKPAKKREAGAPLGDMQITFSAGLSGSASKGSVFENQPDDNETTIEKYTRKEKEKKARKKERREAERSGTDLTAQSRPSKEKKLEVVDAEDAFNDPFFDDPEAVSREHVKAARKAEKAKKREERDKEEAASAAQRAELELLMVDEDAMGAAGIRHFNMNEIEKAEKQAKRKGKKKGKKGEEEKVAVTDSFQMDVKDPRFSRIFENHEYAIDPSNPKFKGTGGMKALLEEGRRKRKGGKVEQGVDPSHKRAKKSKNTEEKGDLGDLKKLAEKVKVKSTLA